MDPEVKKYFIKIINSFSYGLLWMLSAATLGLYFQMAIIDHGIRWYNLFFYLFFLISFFTLLRFFYRTWKS